MTSILFGELFHDTGRMQVKKCSSQSQVVSVNIVDITH